ncbi:MAG: hypothetical protein V4722_07070 [Bacteroidota bacterium]
MKLPFFFVIWGVSCHLSAFSQQDVSDALRTGTNDEINWSLLPDDENNPIVKTDALRGSSGILVEKRTKTTGVYWGLSESKDTLFASHYRRQKLHGNWQSWNANRRLVDSGRLEKNLPDGEWKSWYANGQLRTVRTYNAYKLMMLQNDIRHHNPKTSLHTLALLEQQHPGSYKYYTHPSYSFTNYLPAGFKNKLPVTSLTERSLHNRDAESNYLPPFNQCLQEGLYMNYFANGELKDSGYYHNGLRNGMWVEALQNGNVLSKGAYHNGKRTHSWSYHDRNGRLLGLKFYNKHGREISSKKYD